MTSRGFRNRNPLNIRLGVSHWLGALPRDQTDPQFVVFTTMAYGYRAAWKLMESYRVRLIEARKPYNIHNIIRRWAPPQENDTSAYTAQVVRLSGKPEFQLLTPPEIKGDDIFRIIRAMTCVENGCQLDDVPVEDIREGYRLAFPHSPLPEIPDPLQAPPDPLQAPP